MTMPAGWRMNYDADVAATAAVAEANRDPNWKMNYDADAVAAAAVAEARGMAATKAGGGTGAAGAGSSAQDKANRDAFARLQQVLDDYGLGDLADFVRGSLTQGLSEAEITQAMRETETFKRRFPGIEERRKKGLSPISPGEYVAYERQAKQLMRAAGLPEGFYDSNDDFTKYLVGDVSLSELSSRVTRASGAFFDLPAEDRAELARYGLTAGDATAMFLDPDVAEPLLQRKYDAARLSGAATRTGFGALGEDEATSLVQSGVTAQAAAQGFSNLAGQAELFGSLDAGEDSIGRDQQIAAQFKGNAAAQRRIEERARRRQAWFEGGGGFAAGQDGLSGLGSAPRV